jgi:signal transduction histidine kinase
LGTESPPGVSLGDGNSPVITAESASPTATDELRAIERRLRRLVLDLHDGPLQDLLALGLDLKHFREQLATALQSESQRPLLGRVDDLEARLIVLATDLREIATSAQRPAFLDRPFTQAVTKEVARFEASTGITVAASLSGEFDELTASQRIALLRVLEEALANTQRHTNARTVTVSMSVEPTTVRAEIFDDGGGFDLEQALVRAAREGRLGIVGMSERVRLLGGDFDIETKPGRSTRISLVLHR